MKTLKIMMVLIVAVYLNACSKDDATPQANNLQEWKAENDKTYRWNNCQCQWSHPEIDPNNYWYTTDNAECSQFYTSPCE